MQPDDFSDTNIPKDVMQFMYLAREHINVRRLVDIHKLDVELYERLLDRDDFIALEDTIDAIAAQDDTDIPFIIRLKTALLGFYPLERPEFCQKLSSAINKMGGTITWETILDFQENPKKETDRYEKYFLEMSGATQAMMKDLCLEALGVAAEAGANGSKQFKQAFSKYLGAKLAVLFPRPNKEHVKAELKTDGDRETWFFYSALCDLVLGNYETLDPVIGDEACEARPSVLIDIREGLLSSIGNADDAVYWARGYHRRHRDNAVGHNIRIAQEGSWSLKFVDACNKFVLADSGLGVRQYITLCKANTMASTMAADEWEIVSYDRDKGIYTPEIKSQKRSAMSQTSVQNIRRMARFVCEKMVSDHGRKFAQQVCTVLDGVNAAKEDHGSAIHSLPIYETMRTILAYECLKGRHIILSLYHINCTQTGDEETSPATYDLLDIDLLVYKGNPKSGQFELCQQGTVDLNTQCVAFQGYHLHNNASPIAVTDGCDFFAQNLEAYRQGFSICDITTQIMLYSAVHPVLVHGSKLGNIELEDAGRDYVRDLQRAAVGDEGWNVLDDPFTRKSGYSLLNPPCDLFAEYNLLNNFGLGVGVANKQYMTRPGGKQTCVRTLQSCPFSIHHINVQSLGWVLNRNQTAKIKGQLQRFHNFDTGMSYTKKEDADAVNQKNTKK